MNKINFRLITSLFALAILTASCDTDDFLTQVNPNELSTGSFWKTNADLQMGQVAVYNAFKNTNILNIIAESYRSDLAWPGFGRPNPNANNRFLPFYQHNFNDSTNEINTKWEALYTLIFRANQVIVNGQRLMESYTSETAIEEATIVIAQARFMRGLAYSYLYYSYNNGSVPLIDFVPNGEEEFYQPLAPASDIKDFYIADLEFAYENLPATWDSNNNGRVAAPAAAAELGRSYLYDKDYEKASEYFTDIMNNPAYGLALTDHIGDNFSEAGEFNSESILEINYATNFKTEENAGTTENVASNLARAFAPGSHGGFRTIVPSAWIIMAYKNEKKDTSDARNYIDCDAATDSDCDPVTNQKLRKYSLRASHSLALPDEDATPYYGPHLPGQVSPFNNGEPAYYRKYTNWETMESEQDFLPIGRSPINTRLVRLADIYLMQAECLIKGGSDEGGVVVAMALINEVRKRSALELIGPSAGSRYPGSDHDDVSYNAQSLMDHLMYEERPLELSVEGHAVRFLDLRRWGVIKDRFIDLSTKDYWCDNFWNTPTYSSNDAEPVVGTRFQSVLTEGKPWEPIAPKNANGNDLDREDLKDDNSFKNGTYNQYFDFEGAAANYIESVHGYYPIPNSEVTANPNL